MLETNLEANLNQESKQILEDFILQLVATILRNWRSRGVILGNYLGRS